MGKQKKRGKRKAEKTSKKSKKGESQPNLAGVTGTPETKKNNGWIIASFAVNAARLIISSVIDFFDL
jgi:hypothetical protein